MAPIDEVYAWRQARERQYFMNMYANNDFILRTSQAVIREYTRFRAARMGYAEYAAYAWQYFGMIDSGAVVAASATQPVIDRFGLD